MMLRDLRLRLALALAPQLERRGSGSCGTASGLRVIADEFEALLGGPQFHHDVRVVFLRMLADRFPPRPDCQPEGGA